MAGRSGGRRRCPRTNVPASAPRPARRGQRGVASRSRSDARSPATGTGPGIPSSLPRGAGRPWRSPSRTSADSGWQTTEFRRDARVTEGCGAARYSGGRRDPHGSGLATRGCRRLRWWPPARARPRAAGGSRRLDAPHLIRESGGASAECRGCSRRSRPGTGCRRRRRG